MQQRYFCHLHSLIKKQNLRLQQVRRISYKALILNSSFQQQQHSSHLLGAFGLDQLDLYQEIVHLLIIKVMAIPVVEFMKLDNCF